MRLSISLASVAPLVLIAGSYVVRAIKIDWTSEDSIKDAASGIAYGMMSHYTGNNTGDTPGNLPDPYYWWEAGAMFGAMIDYWYYTGDTTYNDVVKQAILWQTGPKNDFIVQNQSSSTGNDDQVFWGLTAMRAAETDFLDPPPGTPQWLAIAKSVFSNQALRWDESSCGGGLRWQIIVSSRGYNYKNSISNGGFFNLAARLAKYTGIQKYHDWAEKTWNWMASIYLISSDYDVYDGSDALLKCANLNHIQWTYNAGVMLLGAANMYNATNGSDIWRQRVDGLLNRTDIFFTSENGPTLPGVMMEIFCENDPYRGCDIDQKSFKAYLSRWMAATTKMAPFTYEKIKQRLLVSAAAAVQQCTDDGKKCGLRWQDGPNAHPSSMTGGVGEQMAVLEVVQSNLMSRVDSSIGIWNVSRGWREEPETDSDEIPEVPWVPTRKDHIAAGVSTAVTIVLFLWLVGCMISRDNYNKDTLPTNK